MESHGLALRISEQVRATYEQYGYEPVVVPALPVAERVAFIQSRVQSG